MRLLPQSRWGRRLIWAGLSAVVAFTSTVGGCYSWVHIRSAGRLYDQAGVITGADGTRRDVALVLGAGLRGDGTPTPYLAARLDIAYELYKAGVVRVILVSGDNRTQDYNEPAAMRHYLIDKGVPEIFVVQDFAGLDTYDSCYRARHIFEVTSAVVISQSYHTPRAVSLCRSVGIDAIGAGDDSVKVNEPTWAAGEQREIAASVKAVWDVVSRRTPILGEKERSVQDLLRSVQPTRR
ncbi:hypothetical protein KEM60_01381 [Austwickia sp. TVS 96-490-7B]|uniref:SanA/YdcF family protein n=1 Tax=Austwickia sp. TVS 96-490-7B TaxID=2830843 RepID=UPI001E06412F|nr:ElyC/SanA/YdcF family protein [Austwickia sp. TVS 96-490-7B]MBW3085184.1 hypothetical protein [Austwickia sp. TVS 96-490-7B]